MKNGAYFGATPLPTPPRTTGVERLLVNGKVNRQESSRQPRTVQNAFVKALLARTSHQNRGGNWECRTFRFSRRYLTQKENAFLIKITQAGYKPVRYTCQSLQAAEDAIARIEAERRTGLFIDYTKAHQVTFEGLLRRYIKEEGPKNKGWEKSEKYKCLE